MPRFFHVAPAAIAFGIGIGIGFGTTDALAPAWVEEVDLPVREYCPVPMRVAY
jgi:hypothetical protein